MNITDDPKINVSQSTNDSKDRLHRLRNRRSALLILVLIVIAGFGAWFVFKQPSEEKRTNLTPSSYSYDEELGDRLLVAHLLQGSGSGSGLIFKLPLNGVVYTDSPLNRSDSRLTPKKLTDTIIDKGNNVEFGNRFYTPELKTTFQSVIAAKIVPPAEQPEFSAYDYFKELLARMSFNTSEDASKLGMGMSTPAKFSNNQIKNDGNVYQIAASLPDGVESGLIKHVIGELIEVKGTNANYFLLIAAVNQDWTSSPKTWQAIKDSIKVDQK